VDAPPRPSATPSTSTTSTSLLLHRRLPWRHASEPPSDATERPPLPDVPFSVYAADRLLGGCCEGEEGEKETAATSTSATFSAKPETRTRRALETLAALYLRADAAGLADGLASLGLEPLLVAAARLERLLVGTAEGGRGGIGGGATEGAAAGASRLPPGDGGNGPSSSSSSSPMSPCCVADRLPPSLLEAAVAA
jgi:hypothetical protein